MARSFPEHRYKKKKFVWLDLEMTGLLPEHDSIIEIASIITEPDLTFIAQGPSIVIHQPNDALNAMEDWPKKQHALTGLTERVRQSTFSVADAEQYTLDFINEHVASDELVYFAGNSIYQDRAFLRLYMLNLHNRSYYRLIDVTTVKELIKAWYPHHPHISYEKKETHRALDDIYESLEELRHYRRYFFPKGAE
jgi:oligoribonuclease